MNNHSHSLRPLIVATGLALAAVTSVRASEAEDLFKRMDANGDKKVTSLEHATFAENQLKQSDADGDGRISAAECEAASAVDGKKVNKTATATHMRVADTDNDGQINATESAALAKGHFARADKNSDGVLSEDEVEAFHKVLKKELKD